jgi:hypothetical protein
MGPDEMGPDEAAAIRPDESGGGGTDRPSLRARMRPETGAGLTGSRSDDGGPAGVRDGIAAGTRPDEMAVVVARAASSAS